MMNGELTEQPSAVTPSAALTITTRRRKGFNWSALMFLLPKGLLFCGFVLIPFVYTFVLMFQAGTILRGYHFVGLQNIQTLMGDTLFFQTLEHTGLYMLISIPLTLVIPMCVGLLFSSNLPGVKIYRTLIYLPSLLSGVATALVWQIMLDPNVGLIYRLFNVWLGWNIPWLSNPVLALVLIAVIGLWNSLGYYSILFMAGFNDIPKSYFEAARIDGAGIWNVFWRIKLPLIKPVVQLMLVLVTINSIQVFDLVFVLTGGGPGTSTYTVMWYVYQNVFNGGSVGYAAAMGVFMLVVTMIISAIIMRGTRAEALHE